MRTHGQKSAEIKRLLRDHPEMTPRQIALLAGVKPVLVSCIKSVVKNKDRHEELRQRRLKKNGAAMRQRQRERYLAQLQGAAVDRRKARSLLLLNI